ncbi:hypothetical protein QBC33DRAFT_519883 [Phialemonium atrogriseum]|uniref:Uncharacterized protein n=1 Tax=Phialemonium atrogriseum TaxID=1093897 RepID=A0AAJ0BRL5_9PEZI|nr:uncharacterized protein QBC33DRAFT_519883 [Phialemonium atrogriseum]KAK1762123.1 hypothetical protein QBC33DRAFT_519883 [Phialemonium atrogriseum]
MFHRLWKPNIPSRQGSQDRPRLSENGYFKEPGDLCSSREPHTPDLGSGPEHLSGSETSASTHTDQLETDNHGMRPPTRLRERLAELFDEDITGRILRTTIIGLSDNNPPTSYPECIYSLLERAIRIERSRRTDRKYRCSLSMRQWWELLHDEKALQPVLTATSSLFARYNDKVSAIRSRDKLMQEGVATTSLGDAFLVFIV